MTSGTAEQIAAQDELSAAQPLGGTDPAQLGAQAVNDGASATSVDATELLAMLQQMAERVNALEAERQAERDSGKPTLVQTAETFRAHLLHRANGMGPGTVLHQFTEHADQLVDAAKAAVETGSGETVGQLAGSLARGLARAATAAASADVSYPLSLVEDAIPELLDGLKAKPTTVPGTVLARTDAAVQPRSRGLGYQPVR